MKLFPFSIIRSGQQEFMDDVADSVKSGRHLAAHAPTGIGKTAGVLTPALEYALDNGKTVFFLTPKHTQHIIVVDTLRKVHKKYGVNINAVDIIGKQWMCPHGVKDLSSREFNEFCRSKKKDETCDYYNNTKKTKLSENAREVIAEIRREPVHNEAVKKMCSAKNLCPYEVCIEAGKTANVIVCDYFHLFSPQVRKAFLTKLDKKIEDSIIIVDEAHNLPERVRSLLSSKLTDYMLNRAGKEASSLGSRQLVEDYKNLTKVLKKLCKGMTGRERFVSREEFMEEVKEAVKLSYLELVDEVEGLGEEVLKIPGRFRSYSKSVANFLDTWKGDNVGYARILQKEDNKITVSYNCLDPSLSSRDVFDNAHSCILMSGTLIPLHMYSNLLGLDEARTAEKAYKSPFPRENRLLLLVPSLTTKYNMRSEFMYQKYAKHLRDVISSVPGNIAVFYPAYSILESISRMTGETGKEVIVEKQAMKKEDRGQLYNRLLHARGNGGAVLMAVQAGSFSEGMDYPENLLDAVVIVGLPLERPDLETDALIDYYDFKFERGWDYGYIYPAMNRALQAAGRCIRSETDRGAIILMEERFRWANYRKCFPTDFEFTVTETPAKYLEKFWKKSATSGN
ncbi:MAG: ATP-dependent DNA helicase [Candidatus Altiarchaeota archaeon]|nr:ATP-dependent DNA helicase [Candidatus Altiarchaeota archaeon]